MSDFTPRSFSDLELEFPPGIEYLSATGMKTALRCLEQYRRVYIKGERKPPSLALLTGRADHKAIEHSMRKKIVSYEDLPVPEVTGMYLHTLESEVENNGGLSELEDQPNVETFDKARTVGMDGVARYQRQASPKIQPLAVEDEFKIEVPGLPVPLVGYVDLIAEHAHQILSDTRIIDRKTSKRASTKPSAEWVFQGRVYQLYRPLPHEWHVTSTGGRIAAIQTAQEAPEMRIEAPNMVALDKMQQQLRMIGAQIGSMYQRYGPDEEWPASGVTHPFACNYCGFRPDCWYWKGVE